MNGSANGSILGSSTTTFYDFYVDKTGKVIAVNDFISDNGVNLVSGELEIPNGVSVIRGKVDFGKRGHFNQ